MLVAMMMLIVAGLVVLSNTRGNDAQMSKLPREFVKGKTGDSDMAGKQVALIDDADREPALTADGKRPKRMPAPMIRLDENGRPMPDAAGDGRYTINMKDSEAHCTQGMGEAIQWKPDAKKSRAGSPWGGKITVMCFRTGALLDQIRWARGDPGKPDDELYFRTYGGSGGNDDGCFRAVPETQCINQITVRAGGLVDGMSMMSRHNIKFGGKYISKVSDWYGGMGGNVYTIDGGDNRCLEGIDVISVGGIIGTISFCFTH